jgi:hypothetical protein
MGGGNGTVLAKGKLPAVLKETKSMQITMAIISLLLMLALLPAEGMAAVASRAQMQEAGDASLHKSGQTAKPAARRPAKG